MLNQNEVKRTSTEGNFYILVTKEDVKRLIIWTCTKLFKVQPLIKFNFTDLTSTPEIIWKMCSLNRSFSHTTSYKRTMTIILFCAAGGNTGILICLDQVLGNQELMLLWMNYLFFIKFCLGLFLGKETHTRLTSLYMKPSFC